MSFKEQVTGIVIAWVGLHLVGLTMYLDGLTGPNYPVYTFISSVWLVEFWILLSALLVVVAFFISDLCLSESNQISLPTKANINSAQPEPPKPTPLSEPDSRLPPKPPDPTPKDLKEKAISQILGRGK